MDGDMRVKVADFGMARDMHSAEYYRLCHKSRLPVKWMAPESFHDAKFSSKTDVVSWKWVSGLYFFVVSWKWVSGLYFFVVSWKWVSGLYCFVMLAITLHVTYG